MKGRKKKHLLKDDPEIKKLEAKTRVLEAKLGMTLAQLFGTVMLELLGWPRAALAKPNDEDQPDPGEELLNWREKAEEANREEAKKELLDEIAEQEKLSRESEEEGVAIEWLSPDTAPEDVLVLLLVGVCRDRSVRRHYSHAVMSGYFRRDLSIRWFDARGYDLSDEGLAPLGWLPYDTLPKPPKKGA